MVDEEVRGRVLGYQSDRQILENLTQIGLLAKTIRAGARLHQLSTAPSHGTSSRHGPHQRAHGTATSWGVPAHPKTTFTCAALKRLRPRPSQA